MKEYQFRDLYIGMECKFKVKINEEMMQNFKMITGDINPLHNDEKFAKEMLQKERVVYGMLSASFLSTLAGVYLPGKYSLIQQVEIKFLKPIYINDTLNIKGVVSELHESVQQIGINVLFTNQNELIVLKAKMKIGFTNKMNE